jgi:hypothetical protein
MQPIPIYHLQSVVANQITRCGSFACVPHVGPSCSDRTSVEVAGRGAWRLLVMHAFGRCVLQLVHVVKQGNDEGGVRPLGYGFHFVLVAAAGFRQMRPRRLYVCHARVSAPGASGGGAAFLPRFSLGR